MLQHDDSGIGTGRGARLTATAAADSDASPSAAPPIRVAAWVDGLPLEVAGFGALLESFLPDVHPVAVRSDADRVALAAQERQAEVVVLRVHRTETSLWATARSIHARVPAVRILVITDVARPASLDELVRLGVHGLLSARASPARLRRALIAIGSGEVLFEAGTLSAGAQPPRAVLTERQRRILGLVADGLDIDEIAVRISTSSSTVKRELRQLRLKLATKSQSGLAAHAVREGLIP